VVLTPSLEIIMTGELITKDEAAESTAVTIYTDISQRPTAVALREAAQVLVAKGEKYTKAPATPADAEVMAEFRARLNETINKLDAERLETTAPARKVVGDLNADFNATLTPAEALLKKVDAAMKDYLLAQEKKRLAAIAAQQAEEARLAKEKTDADAKAEQARIAAEDAERAAIAAHQAAASATSDVERAHAESIAAVAAEEAQSATQSAIAAAQAVRQVEQRTDVVVGQWIPPAETQKSIRGSHGSSSGLRTNWTWELIDTEEQPAAESIKLVPPEYLVEPAERLAKTLLNAKAKAVKKETTTAVPGIRIYNDPVPASRAGR
jgi:hypothetical protein